ncbi:linear amide C-N hydrolase [Shewanella violacea]|uniref:Choloylglycine hydrolase family protein n=1 Tax=Shewanella violacea (strain JCM 10179 / CIP 106290 / LMG 19151 / DSS12) TaxID=637905 RepID=D4ZCJ2_SHEVD|nr:linear amide C-N hydrolase [Shewanella violacea]BAJ03737.1 choloylglycine hydrolase family protein [Shewanella violacea DSS12]
MCTGIRLIADDGALVFGRTMEFSPEVLHYDLNYVPKGINFRGETDQGKEGIKWQSDNAFVSWTVLNTDIVMEGINEKGLSIGGFFFYPYDEASFQLQAANTERTLTGAQVITLLLSICGSVADAKELLPTLNVICKEVPIPGWDGVKPTLHYTMYDQQGGSAVIEYLEGELVIIDNPLGSITNQPSFKWHQRNLEQYTSLPIRETAPIKDTTERVKEGLDIGNDKELPGGFTAQDRFVRASIYSQVATPMKDANEAILRVKNILNHFDLPQGYKKTALGENATLTQTTQWTSITDIKALHMYFTTVNNPNLQRVSLPELMESGATEITKVKFADSLNFAEVSI